MMKENFGKTTTDISCDDKKQKQIQKSGVVAEQTCFHKPAHRLILLTSKDRKGQKVCFLELGQDMRLKRKLKLS